MAIPSHLALRQFPPGPSPRRRDTAHPDRPRTRRIRLEMSEGERPTVPEEEPEEEAPTRAERGWRRLRRRRRCRRRRPVVVVVVAVVVVVVVAVGCG
eukprot:8760476-Pyramimonas_sp.AAC.1